MNKNDECPIVEDLLYAYNEKLLNSKSEYFVNNHLKDCKNCQNKLKTIKTKLIIETNNEKRDEEIEITHLGKINKIMRILKIILLILLSIIVLFFGVIFIKSKYTEYVVNNAYNKLEELKQLDNYKLIKEVKYISFNDSTVKSTLSQLYYKDGKYKEIIPGTTFYYEDNSNGITYIFSELKSIENNYTHNIAHKGDTFNEERGIRSIYKNEKNIFQKFACNIRNDNFNGIDCYVIKTGNNNDEYTEIWINKENFLTVRLIENYQAYYRETIYDIIIGETLDSDVTLDMKNYEGYSIKDVNYNAI